MTRARATSSALQEFSCSVSDPRAWPPPLPSHSPWPRWPSTRLRPPPRPIPPRRAPPVPRRPPGSCSASTSSARARSSMPPATACSPETGSTIYRFSREDIGSLPLGDSTPVNQVLLQVPGVVQDSYGQLHVRGDHGNVQYRINGVVIPEAISGFGQSLETRFASNISFLTGALPAQYGYRTAGVVDIRTKGDSPEHGGSVGVLGGNHGYARDECRDRRRPGRVQLLLHRLLAAQRCRHRKSHPGEERHPRPHRADQGLRLPVVPDRSREPRQRRPRRDAATSSRSRTTRGRRRPSCWRARPPSTRPAWTRTSASETASRWSRTSRRSAAASTTRRRSFTAGPTCATSPTRWATSSSTASPRRSAGATSRPACSSTPAIA